MLTTIEASGELFHTAAGTTWPLRGRCLQAWLRQQYYERTWDTPSPAARNAGPHALEAQAQFDGSQRKVSVRLAQQDGLIYSHSQRD
jgi:hypothetical protein